MIALQNLPQIITAIGGLGTAAFGLVDATKVFGDWGPNRIGFSGIAAAVKPLIPPAATAGPPGNALSQQKVIDTLQANWYNGTDLGSQKSIAKSLIKLNLNPGNAAVLANQTGVDPAVLTTVATGIALGTPLSAAESDVFSRFDLILTALLDEAYQRSDQVYRNGTRVLAMIFAIGLAIVGGMMLHTQKFGTLEWWKRDFVESLLVGIMATPLAPIAKDLSTALATAVNTLQLVKK
jgi:hypothetical protein